MHEAVRGVPSLCPWQGALASSTSLQVATVCSLTEKIVQELVEHILANNYRLCSLLLFERATTRQAKHLPNTRRVSYSSSSWFLFFSRLKSRQFTHNGDIDFRKAVRRRCGEGKAEKSSR